MKTKTEIITPALATTWLDKHNNVNRKISEPTVQSYAMDMKNGRWTLTHQGIAFDTEGNLQDGQHRLWAIVFSGCTVEMMVTRGVPVTTQVNGHELKTMDAIDRNRVRSTGQQMQLCHQVKNGNTVAAALRGIALMADPTNGNNRISTATSLYLYELYGKDVEAIVELMPTAKHRASWLVGPLAMFHHGEPEKAKEFARQIVTLEGLSSPVRVLRKYFDLNPSRKNADKTLRIVARAIFGFHRGETMLKLADGTEGVKFLTGMFPSLTKKIREAVTPCRVSVPLKQPKSAA